MGGIEPVPGDGCDALIQDRLRGFVPGPASQVERERERGRPVVKAGVRTDSEFVACRRGQPGMRVLPVGDAGGGPLDMQERDPDGATAE
ncbi:hypothetical protein GCM10009555_086080 [Acrocarpospora macrocephala]